MTGCPSHHARRRVPSSIGHGLDVSVAFDDDGILDRIDAPALV